MKNILKNRLSMYLKKHLCLFLAILVCPQLCAIEKNNNNVSAGTMNDITQQTLDTNQEILETAATFLVIGFIEQNFYGVHHNEETEQLLAKALSCLETEDNSSHEAQEFEISWNKYIAQNGYPENWPEEMKSL